MFLRVDSSISVSFVILVLSRPVCQPCVRPRSTCCYGLAGVFCNDCSCVDCCNTVAAVGHVQMARQNIIKSRPGAFDPKVSDVLLPSHKILLFVKHNRICHPRVKKKAN